MKKKVFIKTINTTGDAVTVTLNRGGRFSVKPGTVEHTVIATTAGSITRAFGHLPGCSVEHLDALTPAGDTLAAVDAAAGADEANEPQVKPKTKPKKGDK
jgi:hypothetical protein